MLRTMTLTLMKKAAFVLLPLALATTPARADACTEKLKAFDYMLMVSKFTAEGAAKMYAAKEAALAHQKAGRIRECVRALTEAMGR